MADGGHDKTSARKCNGRVVVAYERSATTVRDDDKRKVTSIHRCTWRRDALLGRLPAAASDGRIGGIPDAKIESRLVPVGDFQLLKSHVACVLMRLGTGMH